MTSSASSANDALAGYLAGRVTAAELSSIVAAEYYREPRNGKREALRPVMDVIERAHPGVVELKAAEQRPGFEIRLAERPFPKRYDAELRQAVERVLSALPASSVPLAAGAPKKAGLLRRIVAAIRKMFSA